MLWSVRGRRGFLDLAVRGRGTFPRFRVSGAGGERWKTASNSETRDPKGIERKRERERERGKERASGEA